MGLARPGARRARQESGEKATSRASCVQHEQPGFQDRSLRQKLALVIRADSTVEVWKKRASVKRSANARIAAVLRWVRLKG
jgi:hypothetical protein